MQLQTCSVLLLFICRFLCLHLPRRTGSRLSCFLYLRPLVFNKPPRLGGLNPHSPPARASRGCCRGAGLAALLSGALGPLRAHAIGRGAQWSEAAELRPRSGCRPSAEGCSRPRGSRAPLAVWPVTPSKPGEGSPPPCWRTGRLTDNVNTGVNWPHRFCPMT